MSFSSRVAVAGLTAALVLLATPCLAIRAGMGIADVTGPATELTMMGFAKVAHRTNGIHLRLFCRSVALEPESPAAPQGADAAASAAPLFVFVSCDLGMIFASVKREVVAELQRRHPEQAERYQHASLMVTAQHTHSGPGGFAETIMYDISTGGFHKPSRQALVDGIVDSIERAVANLESGAKLFAKEGTLDDSGINRSIESYRNNPGRERDAYADTFDTKFILLRVDSAQDKPLGVVTWFATHGTSMNSTGDLISGDNKGVASLSVEHHFSHRRNGSSDNRAAPFVAAFASSNFGDVSPNTRGAFCPDGTPCHLGKSVCVDPRGGPPLLCRGIGPGEDPTGTQGSHVNSTRIIGLRQARKAIALWESISDADFLGSDPELDVRHAFRDWEKQSVSAQYTSTGKDESTCTAAYGASFAAGATDGAGAHELGFFQGANKTTDNALLRGVVQWITGTQPTAEETACHAPKPIFIFTGRMVPKWSEHVLPVHVARIGRLFIAGAGHEVTSMAGRRIRDTLRRTLVAAGVRDPIVVFAGLANAYAGYMTTWEEYAIQRYEGASTIYGPHQLAAYTQALDELTRAIVDGRPVDSHAPPLPCHGHDVAWCTIGFLNPPAADVLPPQRAFGDVRVDVDRVYQRGQSVKAQFWAANPRSNIRRGDSFVRVRRVDGEEGSVVATDASWSTWVRWDSLDAVVAQERGLEKTPAQLHSASAGISLSDALIRGVRRLAGEPLTDLADLASRDPPKELLSNSADADGTPVGVRVARAAMMEAHAAREPIRAQSGVPTVMTAQWGTSSHTPVGLYRLEIVGDYTAADGSVRAFKGQSADFKVAA